MSERNGGLFRVPALSVPEEEEGEVENAVSEA